MVKKIGRLAASADAFVSNTDRWHTSWLNNAGADGWCLYADGYKRAADLLVQHLETTYDVNTVVYPVLFLYRQYIELSLKDIIRDGRYLNHQRRQAPAVHELRSLWNEARPIIKKHLADIPARDLDRIEGLIGKFSELDPTSEGFRYPTKKNGEPSFPYDSPAVNLKRVADVMGELSALLRPISDMLSMCRDLESDFRSGRR